jgi:hypothetical protein
MRFVYKQGTLDKRVRGRLYVLLIYNIPIDPVFSADSNATIRLSIALLVVEIIRVL